MHLSEIFNMVDDQQVISDFYQEFGSDFDCTIEEVTEIYGQPFQHIRLGDDPTVAQLLQAIPQSKECEFAGY